MADDVYAILGQKGGSGKTATAVSVAAKSVQRKKRTLLVDLDARQGDASDWWHLRQAIHKTDRFQLHPFVDVPTMAMASMDFDVVVIDGLPHAGNQTLEIADLATRIILPTSSSRADLRNTVRLFNELRDGGIDPAIIFGALTAMASDHEERVTRETLDNAGLVVLGACRHYTSYIHALDKGLALHEASHEAVRADGQNFVNSLIC